VVLIAFNQALIAHWLGTLFFLSALVTNLATHTDYLPVLQFSTVVHYCN